MRIAIFSDNFYPELSGISDSIIITAKELAAHGHFIHFYVPKYPPEDFKLLGLPESEINLGKNIEITRLASFAYRTGSGQGRALILTGLRWLAVKKFNPDVIHVHLPFGAGIEGLIAAKILKKPLVGTNHTPMREFVRYSPIKLKNLDNLLLNYTVWFYNRCDFMSSPAHAVVDEMTASGFKKPFTVVSNPIDTSEFYPAQRTEKKLLKKKYGFSNFTVFYNGRLAEEKRIDLMIYAVKKLIKQIPDINYVIAGRGPDETRLKQLAAKLGVSKNVKIIGFIGSIIDLKEFAEIYNATDVFAILSTAETQSVAAMRAMACGIPVIASKIWGLAEYVNEENGIPIERSDEDTLPDHVLHLFKNPALRKKLGKNGEEFVKKFSPEQIAKIWEDIYDKTIRQYAEKRGI